MELERFNWHWGMQGSVEERMLRGTKNTKDFSKKTWKPTTV